MKSAGYLFPLATLWLASQNSHSMHAFIHAFVYVLIWIASRICVAMVPEMQSRIFYCEVDFDSERMKGFMKLKGRTKKDIATDNLMTSLAVSRSRRMMLKGAVAGAAGVAIGGAGLALARYNTSEAAPVHALRASTHTASTSQQSINQQASHINTRGAGADTIVSILTVARTAEQLAVTFYSNGIANADQLGLKGNDLENIKAALVE